MFSATLYLMYSCSDMGKWVMAVPASRATFMIQFFCLTFRNLASYIWDARFLKVKQKADRSAK